MAKKMKKQNITLFDNYGGYDFEEEKAALIECNPDLTITDEMVWDSIRDMEDEDWRNCKHELRDIFGDNKVIVSGAAGTWQGNFDAAKLFNDIESAVTACIKDCDYIEVVQLPNRLIKVRSSHHDGTNVFYIKILTERGWTLYDNWDFGCRTKFANLTEYQILEKIWNDSHYSKRCAAA